MLSFAAVPLALASVPCFGSWVSGSGDWRPAVEKEMLALRGKRGMWPEGRARPKQDVIAIVWKDVIAWGDGRGGVVRWGSRGWGSGGGGTFICHDVVWEAS